METKTAKLRVGGHRSNSRRRYKYATVSSEDYLRISKHRWSIHSQGYAYRWEQVDGRREMRYLHREVLGLSSGQGVADHINGNPLDCRRDNLRVLQSTAENLQNIKSGRGRSRYRGVSQYGNGWKAIVQTNGKKLSAGPYRNQVDAAVAAEALRRKHLPFAVPDPKLVRKYGNKLDSFVEIASMAF